MTPTYSDKFWLIIGQGNMIQLCEITQMEREMCQWDWTLNRAPSKNSRAWFANIPLVPTCVLQTISKLAATSTNPFHRRFQQLNSTSPLKPTHPSPPQIHHHHIVSSAYISLPHRIALLIWLNKSGLISISANVDWAWSTIQLPSSTVMTTPLACQ